MKPHFKKMLDEAKDFNPNEQWRIIAVMTKISTESRLEGGTLMKVLEEYFVPKEPAPKVHDVNEFVCGGCGRTFKSLQALTGHGPNKCKGLK